jgi:hypothetical protein
MFICGNDAGAKAEVNGILRKWFGWKHVLDLGDISAARGIEMLPAHLGAAVGRSGHRDVQHQDRQIKLHITRDI